MTCPENIEQFFVTNDGRVKIDLDNLGVSRLIGADIFVSRIFGAAARISHRGVCHALDAAKG